MKKRMQRLLILITSGAMLTVNVAGTAVFAAEAETAAEAGTVDLIEADQTEAATEEETEIETEAVYEEAQTMYMLDDAYVREAPDTGSEALAVAHRGESITVIGEIGAWYHVRIGGEDEAAAEEETGAAAEDTGAEGKAAAGDAAEAEGTESVTAAETEASDEESVAAEAEPEAAAESGDVTEGYVAKKCISSDPAEAEAAVEAQEYAVKLAEEEAARAAQAAAQAAQSAPKGRYEVSRQRYDDCDGSGHGYYEIQYSDGTTSISEY